MPPLRWSGFVQVAVIVPLACGGRAEGEVKLEFAIEPAVAIGSVHACAVIDGGRVRCWGGNELGQLGYGDMVERGSRAGQMPVPDVRLDGKAARVVVSHARSCAVLESGSVRCWGQSAEGQHGYGDPETRGDEPSEMPPPDVDLGGVVRELALGSFHTCALLIEGSVRCWGSNRAGELGSSEPLVRSAQPGQMPPPDVELGVASNQIVSGWRHTCALLESGAVRCWGYGASGQLGMGETRLLGSEPGDMPPPDLFLGSDVRALARPVAMCALTSKGTVRCWGPGLSGQLGSGEPNDRGDEPGEMPPPDVPVGGRVIHVAAGGSHVCALLDSGRVRCWGSNSLGQLGYGDTRDRGSRPGELPTPDVDLGGVAIGIVAGSTSNCALLMDRTLRCWGANTHGELGYGHTEHLGDEPGEMPPPPVPLGGAILEYRE
jgi:alpha-tubulin suppressor-like RCC1 family protein